MFNDATRLFIEQSRIYRNDSLKVTWNGSAREMADSIYHLRVGFRVRSQFFTLIYSYNNSKSSYEYLQCLCKIFIEKQFQVVKIIRI